MSNLLKWAASELELLLFQAKDEEDIKIQLAINRDILQLVETFSEQGHSGTSAAYAITILKRLLSWRPLFPLTGEESEWSPILEKEQNTQQNIRYSAVFRKNFDNSTAYNIDGRAFSEDGGETWYTSKDSFVPIEFPYIVPDNPEYIILGETEPE